MEVQLHLFLTTAADECEWLTSRPVRFTPAKGSRYPMNRRASGPDSRLEFLAFSGNRTLDSPARSLVAMSTTTPLEFYNYELSYVLQSLKHSYKL